MRTFKWQNLTTKQQNAARRFSEAEGAPTTSQCAKYLDYIFAYKNGELSAVEFKTQTGHEPVEEWKQ